MRLVPAGRTGLIEIDLGNWRRIRVDGQVLDLLERLHHRDLHRRGNERAWWENQGIDPLPIAASLWDRTHAVDSAAAELGDHINGLTKLNGKQLTNGFGAAIQRQNDETKPTVRPRQNESPCG
jgi:hypothetical protein